MKGSATFDDYGRWRVEQPLMIMIDEKVVQPLMIMIDEGVAQPLMIMGD